jgi:(S)-2-hydroxy-acid oxidase
MLTVDTPLLGRRNLEIRNQFKLPKHLKIANFSEDSTSDASATVMGSTTGGDDTGKGDSTKALERPPSAAGYTDGEERVLPTGPITFHTHAANPTLNWERDIGWLKEECGSEMQVWVKGVATAEDALLALHHKVDGIVVSNHGGRQLNGALATLDALPEVVGAIKGKIPVHVDGGIRYVYHLGQYTGAALTHRTFRHGTEVFKALALGADFVWIGRPVLWGLAYNGQAGVELCLKLLADEIKLCMGLAGVTSVKEINQDYLVRIDSSGVPHRVSKL